MQVLLLDKGLRNASEDSEVQSVARAITTMTIKELDPECNELLIRFLRESDLIQASDNVESVPIVESLSLLAGLNLRGVDLRGVDLSGADLSGANLSDAYPRGANLGGANLSKANLSNTDLFGADLSGANLSNIDLTKASVYEDQIQSSGFCETNLSAGYKISPDRDCSLYRTP